MKVFPLETLAYSDMVLSFRPVSDLPIQTVIVRNLARLGVSQLFPVQVQCSLCGCLVCYHWLWQAHVIPELIFSARADFPRDVVVCAPTGCGKTLAYVVPVVSALMNRVVCQVTVSVSSWWVHVSWWYTGPCTGGCAVTRVGQPSDSGVQFCHGRHCTEGGGVVRGLCGVWQVEPPPQQHCGCVGLHSRQTHWALEQVCCVHCVTNIQLPGYTASLPQHCVHCTTWSWMKLTSCSSNHPVHGSLIY